MSCTDPIADFITIIRNGVAANRTKVEAPWSREKEGIAKVLLSEGYLSRCEVLDTKPAKTLSITIKVGEKGEAAIHSIDRVSTPGRRQYAGRKELKPVIRGFGIAIVSTSQGILSDRACRERKVGGEVLCTVT